MKRIFVSLIFALSCFLCYCQSGKYEAANCFTVVVGKNASADGSVLLAHNEDDPGELLIDLHKVPGDLSNQKMRINDTTYINNTNHFGYLWIEMPNQNFSDTFMNEFGVTICSNFARSKEQNAPGEIGYYLRKVLAMKSSTAKNAVKLAGELINHYGYSSTGHCYCIADPNEVWILEIVNGKHWVAKRLPDDEIAIIPNYYKIKEINLLDTVNYMGSSDLIDYAIQKSWYDPHNSNVFSFRMSYGDPVILNSTTNIAREWAGLNYFSKIKYDYNSDFPFSFRPVRKISLQDIINLLKNHYEGTQFEMSPTYNNGNPHKNSIWRICSEYNQYSCIAQLRSWLPNEIGNILWFSPRRPCINPYIPMYFGISKLSSEYERESYDKAELDHFINIGLKEIFPNQSSWVFYKFAEMVDENYSLFSESILKNAENIQLEILNNQVSFEKNVLRTLSGGNERAREMLNDYFSRYASLILEDARSRINGLKEPSGIKY